MILIIIPVSFSLEVSIDMEENFYFGEDISFSYTLMSNVSQNVTLSHYTICPSISLPLIKDEKVFLSAGVPYESSYTGQTISEEYGTQSCIAYIWILDPVHFETTKDFNIIAVPTFLFDVFVCRNPSCTLRSNTFTVTEDIYFDYESEFSDVSLTSTLLYPDNSARQLTIPTFMTGEQAGDYLLEVLASKEGYSTLIREEEFIVYEQDAQINTTISCDESGICEEIQVTDESSCVGDCTSETGPETTPKTSRGEIEEPGINEKEGEESVQADITIQEDKPSEPEDKPLLYLFWTIVIGIAIILGTILIIIWKKTHK